MPVEDRLAVALRLPLVQCVVLRVSESAPEMEARLVPVAALLPDVVTLRLPVAQALAEEEGAPSVGVSSPDSECVRLREGVAEPVPLPPPPPPPPEGVGEADRLGVPLLQGVALVDPVLVALLPAVAVGRAWEADTEVESEGEGVRGEVGEVVAEGHCVGEAVPEAVPVVVPLAVPLAHTESEAVAVMD